MGNTPSPSYLAGFLAAKAVATPGAPATPAAAPVDPLALLAACARDNQPPGPADALHLRALGCFHEAPLRDAFRLRLILPGGCLRGSQLLGLAAITQEVGGGWLEWNHRGGLDLPSVPVRAVAEAFRRVEALGLTTRDPGLAGDLPRAPAPSHLHTGLPLPSGRLLSVHLRRLAEHLEARGESEVRLVEPGCVLVPPFGPEGGNPAAEEIFSGTV